MGFDGSSITGFNPIEESDMIAMPDPSSFAILPWRPDENATARMFCDVQVPGGEPYEGDPRWILRRALQARRGHGLRRLQHRPRARVLLLQGRASPRTGSPEILDEGGYFDLTTLDAGSDVRRETILALEQLGIHVEYAHHEVGPSQHEVDMRYKDALAMSDDCMTYRITVKEYAMKYGMARDLHAEAALRRERLGHARAPVALGRRAQRLLRRRRPVLPLADREVVHRRPARATRARSRRCSRSGSTPTSGSCRATRRRSTSPGHGATARR